MNICYFLRSNKSNINQTNLLSAHIFCSGSSIMILHELMMLWFKRSVRITMTLACVMLSWETGIIEARLLWSAALHSRLLCLIYIFEITVNEWLLTSPLTWTLMEVGPDNHGVCHNVCRFVVIQLVNFANTKVADVSFAISRSSTVQVVFMCQSWHVQSIQNWTLGFPQVNLNGAEGLWSQTKT